MSRARSPLKSLAAILDEGDALVALLDEERRLVYANEPLARWLQVNLDSLLEREVVYNSERQKDAALEAACRIAPPPEAFAGQSCGATLIGPTAESPVQHARFLPIAISKTWGVLMIARTQAEPEPQLEPGEDWHAALAAVRAQLPVNLQSTYLIGTSISVRKLREQVQLAAKTRSRVTILAPSGGGADEIAATIHGLSGGRHEGLIPLDCQLQDAETLQSAIRAASLRRSGVAPPAILLRHVGRLSSAAQQELLGFLQLPGFELRIFATSAVALRKLVKKSQFSAELAALLSPLEFRAAPLRQRAEDIPLIAQASVERHNAQGGGQLRGLTTEALELLVAYQWPGDVDELAQYIREACNVAAGPRILPADLPQRMRSNWQDLAHPKRPPPVIDLDAHLAGAERNLIVGTLQQTRGNKSEAARLLSISRPRLLRRMLQLGLITKEEEAIDFQPLPDAPLEDAS